MSSLKVWVPLVVVLALLISILAIGNAVAFTGGLPGYQYRQSFNLTGTSPGAQTNYQVRLTVYKGAGASVNNTLYLDNHAQSWGASVPNDLRFTTSDGSTEMDYWIESSNTTGAVVWVELPTTPASGASQGYFAYYGKVGDTTTSNGSNTFDKYDSFDNLSAWTIDAGSNWTADGEGHHTEEYTYAYGAGLNLTTPSTLDGRKVSWNIRINNAGDGYVYLYSKQLSSANFLDSNVRKEATPIVRYRAYVASVWDNPDRTVGFSIGNGWHRYTTGVDSDGDVRAWIDGVEVISFNDSAWDQTWTKTEMGYYTTNFDFDDFFIANFCDPEPVITAWGAEESGGSTPTVNTTGYSDLAYNYVNLYGNITNDGGDATGTWGIEWGIASGNYSVGNFTHSGSGVGDYGTGVTGLDYNTTYYFRFFAVNASGRSDGSEMSFTTPWPVADCPGNMTVTQTGVNSVGVAWDKGYASENTTIMVKTDTPPVTQYDGWQVYHGTGTSANMTGLDIDKTTYYFWGYSSNPTGNSTCLSLVTIGGAGMDFIGWIAFFGFMWLGTLWASSKWNPEWLFKLSNSLIIFGFMLYMYWPEAAGTAHLDFGTNMGKIMIFAFIILAIIPWLIEMNQLNRQEMRRGKKTMTYESYGKSLSQVKKNYNDAYWNRRDELHNRVRRIQGKGRE